MTTLAAAQVYQLARNAGLGHDAAVIATAIAKGESGWSTTAVGDTTLTDATWGPSIGLWQIRSVKAETGRGSSRDASQLKRPEFNARSMVSISSNGTNWSPWTIYTNGSYRSYLSQVRAAVGGEAPSIGDDDFAPGGFAQEMGGLTDIPGNAYEDVTGFVGDKASGLASGVVSLLVKSFAPAVLIGIGVLGGFTVIAVGAWRGSEDRATP